MTEIERDRELSGIGVANTIIVLVIFIVMILDLNRPLVWESFMFYVTGKSVEVK